MKNRLLIVDDQAGIRLLLKDVFSSQGYSVALATNGKEALGNILSGKFNLVLLDYKLPILNGLEVLEGMKKADIAIPVILMSGSIESIQKDNFNSNSQVEVVAKPFNIMDMSELVKSMI